MCDLRAKSTAATSIRQALIDAGIPIRYKSTPGINHWKVMIYKGDLNPPPGYPALPPRVHFSGANFANGAFSPADANGQFTEAAKYTNYVDEAIYFTDDQAIVQSFMRKYDDVWMDTVNFQNLANVSELVRSHPLYPISPDMNFPPDQDYQDRVVANLKKETTKVDVVMFRITSSKIPNQLIAMATAGIPIRLITDQRQYRNTTYFWDSYNVDRMYMAGIQVKTKNPASGQDMHQKSIVLYGIPTAAGNGMAAFGSSNWTASSSDSQREHNYFTTKTWFVQWLIDQFNRKWNNVKAPVDGGGPVTPAMYQDFVPGYPEKPVYSAPSNGALGQAVSGAPVILKWEGGWWAHKYDIYFGTASAFNFDTSTPVGPPLVADFAPGAATAGVVGTKESYTISNLQPGVTYYWQIYSKTMANKAVKGPIYSFTTSGGGAIPPAPTGLSATAVSGTIVNLSWTDPGQEEGFKVERKLASSTTWAQIGTTAAGVVTYRDQNSGLTAGTSYNYRVRAYTTAGNSGYSNMASVTTPFVQPSTGDVVLYAGEATVRAGNWSPVADATAAGGTRMYNLNAGAAKVATPLANPVHYFEMKFGAQAGRAYHLWIRGQALSNSLSNDSVYVQFDDSVTSGGAAQYRLGTTSAATVVLQDGDGATVNGWGWQDNGWGVGVLGSNIYFANDGTHTIRIQAREDGFSIDQIVLSPDTFLTTSPGSTILDETKLPKQTGIAGDQLPAKEARVLADTYVRAGSYASTSFGAAPGLTVRRDTVTLVYMEEGYLTLDISAVQPGDTVTLRLFGHLSDTRVPTVPIDVFSVANTSWVETALNYNNRPPTSASPMPGLSFSVSGTAGQWYDIDLTSYAQAQRTAGATKISIALKGNVDTKPYATFSSRESAVHPQLLINGQ